jgi:hypothetical protein
MPEANPDDQAPTLDFSSPEVQAEINKIVEARVQEKTEPLLRKRDELLGETKKYKGQIRDLQDKFGEDFSKIDELFEKDRKQREADMTLEEKLMSQFETDKKQLAKLFQEKETKYETELKSMSAAVDKYMVGEQLQSEIIKADGIPHILTPALRSQLRTVKSGEDYKVVVMQGDTPRLRIDGSPMEIADLVKEYQADESWAPAFKSSGASGGSAQGNSSGGGASKPTTRSAMTLDEKVEYVEKHGQAAYDAMPFE